MTFLFPHIEKSRIIGFLDKDNRMGDKRFMRVMGLDIGSRTIGVAVSDELEFTAQGLKTIKRRSFGEDCRSYLRSSTNSKSERLSSVFQGIWMGH